MDKKTKLQRLLKVLTPDDTSAEFAMFDQQIDELKKGLKNTIQVKTLEEVNAKINAFRKQINFSPLLDTLSNIEKRYNEKIAEMAEMLEKEKSALEQNLAGNYKATSDELAVIMNSVSFLESNLKSLETRKEQEVGDLRSRLDKLAEFQIQSNQLFADATKMIQSLQDADKSMMADHEKMMAQCNDRIEEIRRDLTNRINNIPRRGGNANRNITIGGNQSTLSRYTDINLKAGSNVTITYSNNDTTKQLDVTFASSGGGSSVAGTVRSINNVATSQAMGDTSGTDYVYLATAGIKLDLPTATGNTNLYTVKNVSNSSVLVAGTIDDDANGVIMPIKYTSVDLISNDTDWKIT